MNFFCLHSLLSKAEIIEKSKKIGFIPISPKLVHSYEQLKLACLLAKKSFKNKTNLAKIFELEFLLWLCEETDILHAFQKNNFSAKNFLLISFRKMPKLMLLKELKAKEKSFSLRQKATDAELEKISLGRII